MMVPRSCIPDGLKNEQTQIYKTHPLGWVSKKFPHHVNVMDYQLQCGGTFL